MSQQRIWTRLFLILLLALTAAVLPGQQGPGPAEDQGFKIGVEVNMVTVPVTVRNQEGGFFKGLEKDAFRVYEDGEPQEIVFFAQEGLPARIAIVLDSSGSVRTEWGTIKYATKRFIENLKPEDEFALISFDSEIRLKMDWGRRTERVDPVLTSIYCKGATKLWDAIWLVSTDLFKGIREKKAIIIMSDGLDTNSAVSYKEALDAAVRSEAAMYVVSKTEAIKQLAIKEYEDVPHEVFVNADLALRKLSFETGGRVLYPNTFGQLGDIYAQVDEELRNQYTIGYVSSNPNKDGTYREIRVRVNAPGATVSARPGYYAPDELSDT